MLFASDIPVLMLVTDRRQSRFELPELAIRAVNGGVNAIQIREKDLGDEELLQICRSVADAVGEQAAVIVNSSVAVAAQLGIGLHLPESMLRVVPPAMKISPVGRSIHSAAAARRVGDCDFVICGHVFETRSKPGMTPLGLDGLRDVVKVCPRPAIAIGGIKPEHVPEVLNAGAAGIAVVSALNDAEKPEHVARQFRDALERTIMEQPIETEISIIVNGKPAVYRSGQTLFGYLKFRGYHDRMVVVELNGVIIRKGDLASTPISAGDRIEIVHFVGGG